MRELYSTEGSPPDKAFRLWRETITERFVPAEIVALGSGPFSGRVEAATVGDITLTRTAMDAIRSEVSEATMRRLKDDVLMVEVVLAGRNMRDQNGRKVVLSPGDFTVYDGASSVFLVDDASRMLSIEVPRKRFEDALGPTRLYAGLAVGSGLGGASLAVDFMRQLAEVGPRLDEATAARMASIGQDLLIAAVAERLARDPPAQILGDVAVQRAKAHIASYLGDPLLDPGRVAEASGLSLRRLQALFSDRGINVAELIWSRRLAAAAARLSDAAAPDRSIGSIAFSCGFTNQSHFSTRFKARFGLSPRDYRARARLERSPLC